MGLPTPLHQQHRPRPGPPRLATHLQPPPRPHRPRRPTTHHPRQQRGWALHLGRRSAPACVGAYRPTAEEAVPDRDGPRRHRRGVAAADRAGGGAASGGGDDDNPDLPIDYRLPAAQLAQQLAPQVHANTGVWPASVVCDDLPAVIIGATAGCIVTNAAGGSSSVVVEYVGSSTVWQWTWA